MSDSLHDDDFIATHRTSSAAFTRQRKLPFFRLCLILIWNLRAALHLDLERFYGQIHNSPHQVVDCPDPSAFSKSRRFLKASAFQDLNGRLIEVATSHGLIEDHWNNLRLLALDGSTLRLPKACPKINDYFGGSTSIHGVFRPLSRISLLYDVRHQLIIDGEISPYRTGEHTQAQKLLSHVTVGDCVLMDRGYYSPMVIAAVVARQAHFVVRMTTKSTAKWVHDFIDRNLEETLIDYEFDQRVIGEFNNEELSLGPNVKLRLVRVTLDNGEVEVLLTDLIDFEQYPIEEFKSLYHERWGVEEGLKSFKCKVEIENWTGRSVASIEQDFFARILCQNIASSLALAAQPALAIKTESCKHAYKINIKRSLGLLRTEFCRLISQSGQRLDELLADLGKRLLKAATIVRPGRSFPHHECQRNPVAAPYKPIN